MGTPLALGAVNDTIVDGQYVGGTASCPLSCPGDEVLGHLGFLVMNSGKPPTMPLQQVHTLWMLVLSHASQSLVKPAVTCLWLTNVPLDQGMIANLVVQVEFAWVALGVGLCLGIGQQVRHPQDDQCLVLSLLKSDAWVGMPPFNHPNVVLGMIKIPLHAHNAPQGGMSGVVNVCLVLVVLVVVVMLQCHHQCYGVGYTL